MSDLKEELIDAARKKEWPIRLVRLGLAPKSMAARQNRVLEMMRLLANNQEVLEAIGFERRSETFELTRKLLMQLENDKNETRGENNE